MSKSADEEYSSKLEIFSPVEKNTVLEKYCVTEKVDEIDPNLVAIHCSLTLYTPYPGNCEPKVRRSSVV